MRTPVPLAAALLAALAACGAQQEREGPAPPAGPPPPDLQGLYQVTGHTKSWSDCVSEGPAVTSGQPFFRLKTENWITGERVLSFYECESATECSDFPVLPKSAKVARAEGWSGEWPSTSYSGGLCNLYLDVVEMRPAAPGVRVEARGLWGSFTAGSFEECGMDEVLARKSSLGCRTLEVLAGVRE